MQYVNVGIIYTLAVLCYILWELMSSHNGGTWERANMDSVGDMVLVYIHGWYRHCLIPISFYLIVLLLGSNGLVIRHSDRP